MAVHGDRGARAAHARVLGLRGKTAYAVAGYGIANTCMYSQRHLPLHLYSIDGCVLLGAGRLSVVPTNARIRELDPYTMLVGLRFAASWQFRPALYARPFVELAMNLWQRASRITTSRCGGTRSCRTRGYLWGSRSTSSSRSRAGGSRRP